MQTLEALKVTMNQRIEARDHNQAMAEVALEENNMAEYTRRVKMADAYCEMVEDVQREISVILG